MKLLYAYIEMFCPCFSGMSQIHLTNKNEKKKTNVDF